MTLTLRMSYEMYAAESVARDYRVHVDDDESSDEENGGVPLPPVRRTPYRRHLGHGIDTIIDQSMAEDAAAHSSAPSQSLGEPAGELSDPPSSNPPIDTGPGSFSTAFQEYGAEQAEGRQDRTESVLAHFWEKRSAALPRTNYERKWETMPRESWTVRDEELVRDGALAAF
ncbi:MAG: hypothetical protein M1835_007382 [Candelina submexicana]|nr:MAG: hypothetical protein M1835_007382 [Candelina submexicana]